jgi:hypothetical protein
VILLEWRESFTQNLLGVKTKVKLRGSIHSASLTWLLTVSNSLLKNLVSRTA